LARLFKTVINGENILASRKKQKKENEEKVLDGRIICLQIQF